MEPETLTTARLLLRTVGAHDAPAVFAACQDPLIRRWTTVPSPYLPEHAESFLTQQVPDGWRTGTMFTFGAFLVNGAVSGPTDARPSGTAGGTGGSAGGTGGMAGSPAGAGPADPGGAGVSGTGAGAEGALGTGGAVPLVAMLGITMRGMGTGEIGFWATAEHRGRGYVTEATLALAHWAFTRAAVDRVEWRAEVGNAGSRAVAERAGFTMEGVLRSGLVNKGVRRDCWVGSLLPCDLGLDSVQAYLPTPQHQA